MNESMTKFNFIDERNMTLIDNISLNQYSYSIYLFQRIKQYPLQANQNRFQDILMYFQRRWFDSQSESRKIDGTIRGINLTYFIDKFMIESISYFIKATALKIEVDIQRFEGS